MLSPLTFLAGLAPKATFYAINGAQLFTFNQKLPVVDLRSFKLHHHGYALFVNILQHINKRVSQVVKLSGEE